MSWFSFTSKENEPSSGTSEEANGLAALAAQFPAARLEELERFLSVKHGES
jgi:hypothetical protein